MQETFLEDNFEQSILELFENDLGYTRECGYDIERDVRVPFYEDVLRTSLRRINTDVPQAFLDEAIEKITSINDGSLVQRNQRFMRYLQEGIAVTKAINGEETTYLINLIDYSRQDMNDFRVVNQWRYEELSNKRCDVVVFVNGLPVVVIELKSPSAENTDVHDAYLQIKNYQERIPSLFVYNCFSVISDFSETRAGTITANENRYMKWKTVNGDYESTLTADYDTLFRGMFQKKRLLDIIRNFICFDEDVDKTGKILTAYHQYFAVNKAIERTKKAVDTDGHIGVFWHTQGSGKSLSMVFYAHQLIERFPRCTILVVTDRKDLDEQLYGQFARCAGFLHQQPYKVEAKDDLKAVLKDREAGGIIFTTIQKFDNYDGALSQRRNIFVIADEAHRSQYGEEHWDEKSETMKKGFALMMREALPNASFIGFTGTPISNRDKDTIEVFGDYIDVYDMTQAVADGATRPVYYESRVVNLHLDEETLKMLDDEIAAMQEEGATEEQIEKAKHSWSSLDQVLGAPATIDSLTTDIINHYEDNRQNLLTGKAMIVAYSRPIAIEILKSILSKRPAWQNKVKVVLSDSNKDDPEWAQYIGSEKHKKELAREFKDNNSEFKIAIVRDMWLTGFDVPSLSTMYFYKAMAGHNLMQAIARVNRVFPEKEGGLIVDYIGIAQLLKDAMSRYTKRDQKQFGDPDIAKTALLKWQEELEICRGLIYGYDYKPFLEGSDSVKAETIKNAVNYMLAIERETRKKQLIEHSRLLHNATTLCRSLLDHRQKLEVAFFDAVRTLVLRVTGKGPISAHEINERVGALIQQSIKSEGVINLFDEQSTEFSLFDEAFMEQIQKMKQKNLALEILRKLISNKVKEHRRTNVVQSERFSKMLEEALNRYINGLISSEEVIKEMLELAKSMQSEDEKVKALGLTPEEKAFYDALTRPEAVKDFYTNEELVNLTRELTDTLRRNQTIDWNKKEGARAKMRVMIKKLLKKYKYPPEGAEEALQTVMAQCNQWADNPDHFDTTEDYPPVVKIRTKPYFSSDQEQAMPHAADDSKTGY